jgi:8-oxo-dGTP pyrophosphatase MutT (NUDIX family)
MEKVNNTMYCNNCGGKGHLFKTCKDPVLSCGILLIDKPLLPVKSNQTNILMIRRKDSLSFAEFMRGKYDIQDINYIGTLIKNMTLKEQALMATEPFDTLWKSLWGDDKNCQDYAISRDKFNQLDRVALMKANLSDYTEPEWGFPKGRRTRGESDLACAIREFQEETNIARESYVVLKNVILKETFEGLNHIRYSHMYYVALLIKPDMVNLTQKFTTMQRREISGISWKSFDEVKQLIRPHHTERLQMLEQLQQCIESLEVHEDMM